MKKYSSHTFIPDIPTNKRSILRTRISNLRCNTQIINMWMHFSTYSNPIISIKKLTLLDIHHLPPFLPTSHTPPAPPAPQNLWCFFNRLVSFFTPNIHHCFTLFIPKHRDLNCQVLRIWSYLAEHVKPILMCRFQNTLFYQ